MFSTTHAALVRASAAEVLATSGITLLADAEATGGRLTSNRSLMRAGTDGAPPHYHEQAAELFFVLDGALDVLLGEEIHTLRRNDFLVVPPGMPHAFAPAAGADADVLFVFTPGKARFDYYRLLERLYTGQASQEEVVDSQERFDNHYVESPIWQARKTG
jgi:mannose-6-phosphate isomerase-like protein (cupin superfamily)